MHRHRPSNYTIILPVLEGCGTIGVAMLTADVGVSGVALLATVAGTIPIIGKKTRMRRLK